jgi:hypothetical protein
VSLALELTKARALQQQRTLEHVWINRNRLDDFRNDVPEVTWRGFVASPSLYRDTQLGFGREIVW